MDAHLGTGMEEVVQPLIQDAEEELFICSPYLSAKYSELLVEKADEGVETTVVTTAEEADYHREALEALMGGSLRESLYGKAAFVLGVASLGFLASAVAEPWLGAAAILTGLLAVVSWWLYHRNSRFGIRASGRSNLEVIVEDDLHAKIYAADRDHAVVGSCNLTSRGLTEAIESGIELEGSEAEKLVEEFQEELVPD